ncbi:deoxyribonuclease V [Desulfopila sp. IMCC35008]|uniref:deoxyribonuclease V n=1 Tax=Desulfopila sp. IMCC35008 TaxID=2653858 RepID=UPI0013D458AE|nr:deoxyribonuclease V [Desulfopila sp. IMCC35008]
MTDCAISQESLKRIHSHDWDITPGEAVNLQKQLCPKVRICDEFSDIQTIAGVDVGFDKMSNTGKAAIAVLGFGDLKIREKATAEGVLRFPYVPGLLSFREMPLILEALRNLSSLPDMIICDGQGTAHPRRFGIACHLGVVTGIPCIGSAKSRLCGSHGDIPETKGEWTPLYHRNEVIGAVVRSRRNVKPIYVSAGHKVSLESAVTIVMHCITRYKLPETTRQAHKLSLFNR